MDIILKNILTATEEDLNDLFSIGINWELYRVKYMDGLIDIKFRKKYESSQIQFNEDGYEYKTVFVNPYNLSFSQVQQINKKGYSTPYNNL